MTTHFNFQTSSSVIFGLDSIHHLPNQIRRFGEKALILCSKSLVIEEMLITDLQTINFQTIFTHGEPNIIELIELTKLAQEYNPDCIVGIGGGSVIDKAKAISAFITNHGEPADYLEIVGKGLPINKETCPVIAIPTTAGAGTEVTRNAVINIPDKKIKVSLRSEWIMPRVAIIDPVLTKSLSRQFSAGTGMDALTQLIEPYLSIKANDFTDLLCLEGIERISRSFQKVIQNGNDIVSRSDMSFASLLGGMALTNAGLGAVHGFAGVIGGMFDAPHGFICARLLPAVFEMNYQMLKNDLNFINTQSKMEKISSLVTGKAQPKVEEGISWLFRLVEELGIPQLQDLGISKSDFPIILEKTKSSSSMKGNPVLLTDESLLSILDTSF